MENNLWIQGCMPIAGYSHWNRNIRVTPYEDIRQRVVAVKAQQKKQALDYSSGLERARQSSCNVNPGVPDYLVDGCDASLNWSGDSHRS